MCSSVNASFLTGSQKWFPPAFPSLLLHAKEFFLYMIKNWRKKKKKSYQVHLNDMSCHKLGPVHQAVRPSHLDHLTLRRWSKLSAVSVLTGKKQTKFKET